MKPSLTIIIPVYNVEAYLKKCLDSILVDNQFTGQVICVNDGSTDGSAVVLGEYAAKYPNVEVITQKNAGLSAARNTGFDKATGEYVFFVDSDDWMFPSAIDKIMNQIEGEDVMYFNTQIYHEDTGQLSGDVDLTEMRHVSGREYLETVYDKPRNMPYVCVCGGIYKRSFLKENHLYNEQGIYHEDNYFTPQVLLVARDVSCINEYVYVYRIRKGSITAKVTEKHIMDLLFIARNLYGKYQKRENVNAIFYRDVCDICITLINAAYHNGIRVQRYWRYADSRFMRDCAYDGRSRKIAKLTYLSPQIAYKYMTENLPSILRRLINKYV